MKPVDILLMAASILGGLAFFLYGMNAMSGGLESMAGGALEKTLKKVTRNGFLSFFLGGGITIAIQSSSAMTVMLVGLVNSGILAFGDTFTMILGSDVGTTLTAWLLSLTGISGDNFFLTLLKPMTFAPILAFIGIILVLASKKERRKNLGTILIGFTILMVGMDMMSSPMAGISEQPVFKNMLTAFSSPIVALLISTVFTGIIQSSAATIGIVQALAITGQITYQMAIPLILGANIGTCITAFISSFGTNRDAKRVVALHILIKVIGSIVFIAMVYIFGAAGAEFLSAKVSMLGVAVVHTLFNLINTILLAPFKKPLLHFCEKLVPYKDDTMHTVFLDERLFNNTPLAISECARLTNEMGNVARKAMLSSIEIITDFSDEKAQYVKDAEKLTDKYEDKLSTYLVKLSNNGLLEGESHQVARLLHSIGDFERIGDHALNIYDVATEIRDKKIVFSDTAMQEIKTISSAISEILTLTIDSFINNDAEMASHVEPLEQVIDELRATLKSRHVERLQNGECTIQLGFVYSDLLTNYERVADHCSNIAVYTIQQHSAKLDAHKYLKNVAKDPNSGFTHDYESFAAKYAV